MPELPSSMAARDLVARVDWHAGGKTLSERAQIRHPPFFPTTASEYIQIFAHQPPVSPPQPLDAEPKQRIFKMETSKVPVKLVKVTRVLGRTGTNTQTNPPLLRLQAGTCQNSQPTRRRGNNDEET